MNEQSQEKRFIKGIIYETSLWYEEETGKYFTKCLKCGNIEYIDKDHYQCSKCGEDFGDYHHELITSDAIEELAWSYLKSISEKTKDVKKLGDYVIEMIKGEDVPLDEILEVLVKTSKYHMGYSHMVFSPELGNPVESEVVRSKITFNGKEYPDYIWKAGFIVCDEIFEKVKNGDINSFSFGGYGKITDLFEVEIDD